MELFEYSEAINKLEECVDKLLSKPIEEITTEEIEYCKYLLSKIEEEDSKFENLEKIVKEKISEIEEKEKLYPLLDRSELISPEDDKSLKQNQEVIEKFENIKKVEKVKDFKRVVSKVASEKWREKREKRINDAVEKFLTPSQSDIVFMIAERKAEYGGWREKKPISRKTKELIEELNWPYSIEKTGTYPDPEPYIGSYTLVYEETTRFKEYKECSLEEKQKIKEYEVKINEILSNESVEYDVSGVIRVLDKDITITKRELAKAGILAEDVRWKEKEQTISNKDIAEADKEKGLTTTEVGFFGRIINKIRAKFQGKGEK